MPRAEARATGDDLAARVGEGLKPYPKVVIGVSGGPDSVALLVLAARVRAAGTIVVFAFDHALRPESGAEIEAVAALCRSLGVTADQRRWEHSGEGNGGAVQERARDARYAAMVACARDHGATAIVTAHHADDQAETVLMRLFRGSGLDGLEGMDAVTRVDRGLDLVRPLLGVRKAALVAFLDAEGIASTSDPSNDDPRFLRARLRRLVPDLAREGFDTEAILAFRRKMARANAAIEAMAGDIAAAMDRDRAAGYARYLAAPADARMRYLLRVIERRGVARSRPSDGELERLDAALATGHARRTLGGLVFEAHPRAGLLIGPAPPRRDGR